MGFVAGIGATTDVRRVRVYNRLQGFEWKEFILRGKAVVNKKFYARFYGLDRGNTPVSDCFKVCTLGGRILEE